MLFLLNWFKNLRAQLGLYQKRAGSGPPGPPGSPHPPVDARLKLITNVFIKCVNCYKARQHSNIKCFLILGSLRSREVTLRKVVLKICSKFIGEQPCWRVTSIKYTWKEMVFGKRWFLQEFMKVLVSSLMKFKKQPFADVLRNRCS